MRQHLILLILFFLISGCTVGPDYVPPKVIVPDQYKEAPEGWKFATPLDTCSRGEWWLVFNDPVLDELEEKLNTSNQTIAAAFAQYQEARALVAQAMSQFYPTISAQTSINRQKASSSISSTSPAANITPSVTSTVISTPVARDPITLYDLQLNVNWAPDIWGLVRRTVEGSIAGAKASESLLASTRLLAQASLAQFYFQLRGLDGDQKILDDTVCNYEKLLKITLNQYAAGTASRANVLQSQSLLELAQAAAIDNGILRGQVEHAIAVLIGEPPAAFCLPPDPIIACVPEIPFAIPSILLERRPDIAQAERLVAQANAQIGVAYAAYFPVITISGVDGYNSTSISTLFSKAAHFWSYGFQIAETLFDGGLRRGILDQAEATYDQTVAQYRQTVLAAFQNVEDNLVSLRILDEEIEVLEQALKTSKETLSVVMNEYKAGTAAFADVLNAELTVYTAAKSVNDTGAKQMTSAVGLITALGGGWSTDMLENPVDCSCNGLPKL